MFEFAEEAFDMVALFLELGVKCREPLSGRHQPDVGYGAAFGEDVTQAVAVIGAVGQQGLACTLRSSARFTPRTFVGRSGWITDHSKSVRSKRAMPAPCSVQEVNHGTRKVGIPFMSM